MFGVLVGHGDVPAALLKAASDIVGTDQGVALVTNATTRDDQLQGRLDQVISEHPNDDILLMVDMYGSSCSNVSMSVLRRHADRVSVVCGINLPMLVRFLVHRNRRSRLELVELLSRTGHDELRSRTG